MFAKVAPPAPPRTGVCDLRRTSRGSEQGIIEERSLKGQVELSPPWVTWLRILRLFRKQKQPRARFCPPAGIVVWDAVGAALNKGNVREEGVTRRRVSKSGLSSPVENEVCSANRRGARPSLLTGACGSSVQLARL